MLQFYDLLAISFHYFISVLVFAFIFGTIRTLLLEPKIGHFYGVLIEAPLLALVSLFMTKKVILHNTQYGKFSLNDLIWIGIVSLLFQQIFEIFFIKFGSRNRQRYKSIGDYFNHYFNKWSGVIEMFIYIFYAAAPAILSFSPQ